jgi:predicted Rdx family selenoprotein
VELVVGSGGIFEISIDGALAFSKQAIGRFPEANDLDALVP